MKKGYLYYYKKWMKSGRMPECGLCVSLPEHLVDNELFKMIRPDDDDEMGLFEDKSPLVYWGREANQANPLL